MPLVTVLISNTECRILNNEVRSKKLRNPTFKIHPDSFRDSILINVIFPLNFVALATSSLVAVAQLINYLFNNYDKMLIISVSNTE
jgi:hypothetical protein